MPTHPLEPHSPSEVQTAVQLLRTQSLLTATTRIISLMLKEPAASVYACPMVTHPTAKPWPSSSTTSPTPRPQLR